MAAYPITEIQVIGTDIAEMLRADGIRTTVTLLRLAQTPKQRLKLALKTGARTKNVLDWVTAADRMRIRGVGWGYSELLRVVGVRTASELRFRNPERLARAMKDANDKRKLVRVLPSANTVKRWIESAKQLQHVIRY